MAGPSAALSPVIAASTHWLARAYPATGEDHQAAALAELQARQAVTVAAWLRYPTPVDAELVALAGPGGSAVLDWRAGSEPVEEYAEDEAWRTWVDEVVVSWGACLLADPVLAVRAVSAVAAAVPEQEDHRRPRPRRAGDLLGQFRRLTTPNPRERAAAVLLRHPDLLDPVAGMHRDALRYLLGVEVPNPWLGISG
ncbi:hypothetical protein EV385_0333 [Krasilnikovia cinnamomea]|uniref:Uncharacterized protein n=1 Tax=Krasilnikovia cinnamomea TaxID=349313 RepID=A0A4V2G6H2_9ACTN|nr:hypothetical protein [Krasilnikovia cinnamomea]RZU48616.1 hypothetical protein EV385_0333 [Krasilnikovia cinnamomea]